MDGQRSTETPSRGPLRDLSVRTVSVAGLLAVILVGLVAGWYAAWPPWGDTTADPQGITGASMASACDRLPHVGVTATDEGVAIDFTNPPDGFPVDEARARIAEHGLDAIFAVQPVDGAPVGRIMANGGQDSPAVDTAEIAGSAGRPSALSLPREMDGQVWFTLACTPR